ncbi:L,D-transpeptidase [Candidatus Uhrbacteria bacterium]|nr:L,D-transpeptidase [Candidatus Uhrbacteria bacterium]
MRERQAYPDQSVGAPPPTETQRSHEQREHEEEELSSSFWLETEDWERAHPMGPETDEVSVVRRRRKEAASILERLRQSPLAKPLLRMMSLLVGIGSIGYGSIRSREQVPPAETEETAAEDPGVAYELQRLVYDDLLDRGEVRSSIEARFGREGWSQEERLEYRGIPNLEGQFEYLHKATPELVGSLRDPRGRLENFDTLFTMMSLEFEHTSLPYRFAKDVAREAGETLAGMDAPEALTLYKTLAASLGKQVGLARVREMASGILEALSANHPVVEQINKDGVLSADVDAWFKPSLENVAYFDQVNGRVEMYHKEGKKMVLLEAFPGNGGPASGVAWEPGLPGHVMSRTPDGEFTFDRTLEKKSPSWKFSWLADTAPLRWAEDGKEVEYQDQDGKWRLLTGEDAEFVVYGAPQKPFREQKKSHLYRQASHEVVGRGVVPPLPFTAEDALDENGELRAIWDRNDFGPTSIRMKDARGELMSVFFHSSPGDEGSEAVLDTSHGCIHMKPDDIESMGKLLKRGSTIRISSVDEMTIAMN